MMEATAEAFLAAAQSDVALAIEKDQTSDDDRSSSLSDIDDGLDSPDSQLLSVHPTAIGDNDSEAETERIEDSPEKMLVQKKLTASPSRLGHSIAIGEDLEPEIFSDSAISSPLPSDEGSLNEELEEEDLANENSINEKEASAVLQSAKKRKRSLLGGLDDVGDGANGEPRRKRTRSLKSNGRESSEDSGEEDGEMHEMRHKATVDAEEEGPEGDDSDGSNEEDEGHQDDAVMANAVFVDSEKKPESTRRASRRKAGEHEDQSPGQDVDNQVEEAEGSDEDEAGADEEADDAEAIAKSEEEVILSLNSP
jgi:hypothetical protein